MPVDQQQRTERPPGLMRFLIGTGVLELIFVTLLLLQSSSSFLNSVVPKAEAPDQIERDLPSLHPEKFSRSDKTDPKVQNAIGWYYISASKEFRNYEIGIAWFERSAKQGNAQSQFMMGQFNRHGVGISQDYQKALEWYRKAEAQGSGSAMYEIGRMYHHGLEVSKDYHKAQHWYEKSVKNNTRKGFLGLGLLYENGLGVTQSYEKALQNYNEAAVRNLGSGYFRMGRLYELGLGVHENLALAKKHYERASYFGSRKARRKIRQIEDKLNQATAQAGI